MINRETPLAIICLLIIIHTEFFQIPIIYKHSEEGAVYTTACSSTIQVPVIPAAHAAIKHACAQFNSIYTVQMFTSHGSCTIATHPAVDICWP